MSTPRKVQVGILGCGTVGSGVAHALLTRRRLLAERAGIEVVVKRIAAKRVLAKRPVRIPRSLVTSSVNNLLDDKEIDIIVELIGGVHPAKEYILKALQNGKHVVTANKALIAEEGKSLFSAAKKAGRELYFEASVGGGIPIVKAIREGFITNHIESLYAIINGTSNYILTQMSQQGLEFRQALAEAQKRGYAERNPALDINGNDAAHKLAILCLLAFGRFVPLEKIYTEGISRITANDLQYAQALGYSVKLLAIGKQEKGEVEARVHPTLIPQQHLLASVKGVYNAIYLRGDMVGKSLLYGRGAGQMPTASAVISDIVDLARNIAHGVPQRMGFPSMNSPSLGIKPMWEVESRYYIRILAQDKPGVLAEVARILGRHQISIASVIQQEKIHSRMLPVVMMTHQAQEKAMQGALRQIDRLNTIHSPSLAIRVEEAGL
ncbi:MAG: homoserine dehydrogenase [Candidatus Omnitrophica bacterium]|nr:homoserine dehydrogenase [Candidatus Omnitrophota bacterium]